MTSTILVILGVWVSDCMSYMCTTWWSRSMIATSTLLPSKVCHEGFSINHIDQGVSGTTVLQSKVCLERFSKLPLLSPHHSELFWLPERTILNLKRRIIMSKNICWFFFIVKYHEYKWSNQYWWAIKRLFSYFESVRACYSLYFVIWSYVDPISLRKFITFPKSLTQNVICDHLDVLRALSEGNILVTYTPQLFLDPGIRWQ